MQQFTKSQKKHLRKMVGIAYKRHMEKAMAKLQQEFKSWNEGAINVWELNQKIHEYHNELSRDLYKMYVLAKPDIALAFAINNHILDLDEIREDCRSDIKRLAGIK